MDPLRNYRGEDPAAFIDPRGSTWRGEDYEGNREDVDAWIALLNFAQRKRFSNSDRADEL